MLAIFPSNLIEEMRPGSGNLQRTLVMVNYSVMFLGKIQCSVVRVKAQFGEWIAKNGLIKNVTVKAQFGEWFAKDGMIKNFLYMHGDVTTCEM